MSGHLPPELWYRILTKLPVKSILRLRCVSKTWYSQISCPNFVSDHATETLNHSSRNSMLVHRINFETVRDCFSFYDESFLESHELDPPEPLSYPGFRIVGGSCNGLICLTGGWGYTVQRFLIWNPSIGKSVRPPDRSWAALLDRYLLGFGFDSNSNDYKVLRVEYRKSDDFVPAWSEIFDMRKGVWRTLSLPMTPFPFRLPCSPSCVYLNGTLHWIGNESRSNCSLLCFNLSSEVFLEMGMPLGLQLLRDNDDFRGFTKVLPINGLLSAVLSWQLHDGAHCLVWSMKEYGVTESWTKLFHIKPPSPLTSTVSLFGSNLFGFRENGEVFMLHEEGTDDKNDVLVLYDPESRTSIPLLSTEEHIFNVCFYTDSLVLL